MATAGIGARTATNNPQCAGGKSVEASLNRRLVLLVRSPTPAPRGESVQDRHRGGVEANVGGRHILIHVL
jgi:hypothetical protein